MLFSTTLLAVQTLAGTLVLAVLTLGVSMVIGALSGGADHVAMLALCSVLAAMLALAVAPGILERSWRGARAGSPMNDRNDCWRACWRHCNGFRCCA